MSEMGARQVARVTLTFCAAVLNLRVWIIFGILACRERRGVEGNRRRGGLLTSNVNFRVAAPPSVPCPL